MKRILLSLLVVLNYTVNAQCDERYSEEIFDEVSVSTVTYSDVHNLKLDIYQAEGDTVTNRPLLILAHGGSFISGIRSNPSMVTLGQTFAKRGYVVASISYRLMTILDLFTSEAALNGVAKALSDGRGAVRYFRKTVDLEGNPYGIDENQIYFGGNSAGGVIAVHAAFMQEEDITDPELLTALNALGGIEGDSGNDGYSSEVRGAISLAGAAADVNFITINENHKLLISCHGDEDAVVPYNCGQPLENDALPQLCGGGAMFAHTQEIGFTNHNHLEFEGAGHVPWEYAGDTQTQMIEFVSENLLNALDCANVGVEELTVENSSVYPNPTQNIFKFENEKSVAIVTLYTLNGTQVLQVENTNTVDVQHLPKGIYLVEMIDVKEQKSYTRVVKM